MDKILDDPETMLRHAANHVRYGYAWFYSDRAITIPAERHLLSLADELLKDRLTWQMILARS
jgi:hypothetical protein